MIRWIMNRHYRSIIEIGTTLKWLMWGAIANNRKIKVKVRIRVEIRARTNLDLILYLTKRKRRKMKYVWNAINMAIYRCTAFNVWPANNTDIYLVNAGWRANRMISETIMTWREWKRRENMWLSWMNHNTAARNACNTSAERKQSGIWGETTEEEISARSVMKYRTPIMIDQVYQKIGNSRVWI